MPSPNDSNNSTMVAISPANVGTSGVYFVENISSRRKSAVFKPFDEEQGMVNNPKGFTNAPLKSNFKPGQGIIREYAAYLLDWENFCKIPKTQLAHIEDESFHYQTDTYPKLGALQEFVQDSEEISSFGLNLFSDFEIQKIALLDIRLLNCDRNDQNVLVIKKSGKVKTDDLELVPIDHAYCLPPQLYIERWDWFWFNYPQISRPVCKEIIDYMNRLNIDKLLDHLSHHVSVSPHCLFLIRLVHNLIVKSLNIGLTILQIASMVARIDVNVPSPLEKIITEAENNAFSTMEARSGRLNSHSYRDSFDDLSKGKSPRQRSNSTSNNSFYSNFKSTTENFISDLSNRVMTSPLKFQRTESFELLNNDKINEHSFIDIAVSKITSPVRAKSSESYLLNGIKIRKSSSGSFDESILAGPTTVNSDKNALLSTDTWEITLNLSVSQLSRKNLFTDSKFTGSVETTESDVSEEWNLSTSPTSSNYDTLSAYKIGSSSRVVRDSLNSIGDSSNLTDVSTDTYDSHPNAIKIPSRHSSFNNSIDGLYLAPHSSYSNSFPNQSLALRRMVSFTANGSAPMYDCSSLYEDKLYGDFI
eukprot:CAMPEP_0196761654 /NCGR_PEP_ID=MMETSP1095-20130614/963_1 /TAXON_ID=96789 ORGANISM="Chromulina nebulosa, Strain UTEXLB2642" /NCGR_SAMPLE_ID=MMETSP1095 /ASSEMBLY_ACC=CAM_ASM_000446 /LENGTH=586 /DNA_ID=CAMNT_0042111499 /DNA_START=547 /DNA_END=2306 /DNA_ORIENTATION=+